MVTKAQQIALMKDLTRFFQAESTGGSINAGTGTVFSSHLNDFPGNDITRLDILAPISAGADEWRETEQPENVRGIMGVSIWFGAGVDHPANRAQWENGLPFWPVVSSGSWAGKVWQAGQIGVIFCIAYPGDVSELWTIPGGILAIIEGVKSAGKQVEIDLQTKPETYINFHALKPFAMIAATDKSAEITRHMRRKSSGAKVEENPFITAQWQKSTAAVFFAGKATEAAQNIQSPDDLRAFIGRAFEGKSFAILLTLCLMQAKANKSIFEVSIPELCRAIWGAKYQKGEPGKVWETLEALNQTEIKLSQPGKGKTTEIYRFRPVTIRRETLPAGKNYPIRARVQLFDMGEGKSLSKILIPGNIESLKPADFELLIYLLVKQNQYPAKADKIEINEAEIMQAAGLQPTYKGNKSQARSRIKAKIDRLSGAGCIGELIEIRDGVIYLKYEGQKRALNQRKGKSG